MKRWKKQNPIRLDEKELKTYIYNGFYIFVGSSCDMFADDIPDEWIKKVLKYIRQFPYTRFFLQSKNPKRILPFLYPADTNFIICTTIETNRIYPSIMGNTPSPKERAAAISNIFYEMNSHNMKYRVPVHITIEPILDFDMEEFVPMLRDTPVSQINIGADSCNNHLPEPPKEKVLGLISELQRFTDVVHKKNLTRLLTV
jgi:DNA repair photolyase